MAPPIPSLLASQRAPFFTCRRAAKKTPLRTPTDERSQALLREWLGSGPGSSEAGAEATKLGVDRAEFETAAKLARELAFYAPAGCRPRLGDLLPTRLGSPPPGVSSSLAELRRCGWHCDKAGEEPSYAPEALSAVVCSEEKDPARRAMGW